MAETARCGPWQRQSIMCRAVRFLPAGFVAALTIRAQQTPPLSPSFEVASVKPGDPNDRNFAFLASNGRFTATNQTLKTLIGYAFDVRQLEIMGGPGWLDVDKYNVEAKSEKPRPSPVESRAMYRSLLEDRFKLAAHRETKPGQVYELAVAKGGSKLKESASADQRIQRLGFGRFAGTGVSIGSLVSLLSQQLERTVIDKTGLTRRYDSIWISRPTFRLRPILRDLPSLRLCRSNSG
jgi:uncharacterized protein (TIGR03435 family)